MSNFITLEGGEGSGKTTQTKFLADVLEKSGCDVLVTREPGGTEEGEKIRELLVRGHQDRWDAVSETFLFFAARRDHWKKVIEPALKNGVWVICDRFIDSTLVYQGLVRGIPVKSIYDFNDLATDGQMPDLTFVMDIEPAAGLTRSELVSHGEARFESKGIEFHQKVRQGFLDLAVQDSPRCVIVDAELPRDEVSEILLNTLEERFSITLEAS